MAFAILMLSCAVFVLAVRIPAGIVWRRRAKGLPFRFQSIPEIKDKDTFPRGLFSMRGMTGGPMPMKAPLSGKDCYFYELVYTPKESTAKDGTVIMQQSREFIFYSPKGAVGLDPLKISRESHVSMRIDHASRVPLAADIRARLQRFGVGVDGSLEERIIPAMQNIQLVGRAERINPISWRIKKGPGVFPMVLTSGSVTGLSSEGGDVLTLKQSLATVALLFGSLMGFYIFQLLLST